MTRLTVYNIIYIYIYRYSDWGPLRILVTSKAMAWAIESPPRFARRRAKRCRQSLFQSWRRDIGVVPLKTYNPFQKIPSWMMMSMPCGRTSCTLSEQSSQLVLDLESYSYSLLRVVLQSYINRFLVTTAIFRFIYGSQSHTRVILTHTQPVGQSRVMVYIQW